MLDLSLAVLPSGTFDKGRRRVSTKREHRWGETDEFGSVPPKMVGEGTTLVLWHFLISAFVTKRFRGKGP